MPRMTINEAECFAGMVIHHAIEEERGEFTMESVIKDVLTSTPCYYASNPRELERHITENWEAIRLEAITDWTVENL